MLQDEAKRNSRNAGFLGKPSKADAGAVVDRVGDLRAEIAERIIGQSSKMNDGIEALDITGSDVTDVLLHHGNVRNRAPWLIGASFVEIAVEPHDVVPCLQQHRHHHCSDVAKMTRYKDLHDALPISFGVRRN